jgi:hypothetical protein
MQNMNLNDGLHEYEIQKANSNTNSNNNHDRPSKKIMRNEIKE